EAFPRPPTTTEHRCGLVRGQRLRKRRLRPRLECSSSHRAELAGLPDIETRRGEPQEARLRKAIRHGRVDHTRPRAEPQELAHRRQDSVHRRPRAGPASPLRRGLQEMLEAGQSRHTDRAPIDTLAGAPAEEPRYPTRLEETSPARP